MKLSFYKNLLMALSLLLGLAGCSDSKVKIKPVIDMKATPFCISQVHITDGPFKHSLQLDSVYLLKVDVDRLLHRFRLFSGLEPKGEIYGGWESRTLSGHSLGHYLTACAQMYLVTGDVEFKNRVNYIVDELGECQDARGTGYIGSIPREDSVWMEVAAGDIRSSGFDLNGAWSPWYTLHKVYQGLIDAYLECDNKKALAILIKYCDWVETQFKDMTDEQVQQMLNTEFGGMNDIMAEVYEITGDKRYLNMANRLFYHEAIMDPLAEGKDILPGKHSNTQIPKIIGAARVYELTGVKKDYDIANFFWNTVVHHHTYATGGNTAAEYFGPRDVLSTRLTDRTQETCNTHNMLKLTRHLFAWNPTIEYADFYELAMYNHILASQDPESGMFCYMVPLKPGIRKTYSNEFDNWTCCHGTGMENPTKHGESIYFKSKDGGLYVNMFIPSVLDWTENGVKIQTETKYPEDGNVKITFTCSGSKEFPMYIRYPSWALPGMKVLVNGAEVAVDATPGNYVTVKNKWKTGDVLEFSIPYDFYTVATPDDSKKAAIAYGPIVLAAELGDGPRNGIPWGEVPVLVAETGPSISGHLVQQGSLKWATEGIGRPKDVSLIPFYAMHGQNYTVYFDFFANEEEWNAKQKDFEAFRRIQDDLDRRRIDFLQLGEMQPERDHELRQTATLTGETEGRKSRDVRAGGWLTFDMKVQSGASLELVCTYWGGQGDQGKMEMDIFIDETLLTTVTLTGADKGKFINQAHSIPADLISGKSKVNVKMQAKEGNPAPLAVYGCTVARKK